MEDIQINNNEDDSYIVIVAIEKTGKKTLYNYSYLVVRDNKLKSITGVGDESSLINIIKAGAIPINFTVKKNRVEFKLGIDKKLNYGDYFTIVGDLHNISEGNSYIVVDSKCVLSVFSEQLLIANIIDDKLKIINAVYRKDTNDLYIDNLLNLIHSYS